MEENPGSAKGRVMSDVRGRAVSLFLVGYITKLVKWYIFLEIEKHPS